MRAARGRCVRRRPVGADLRAAHRSFPGRARGGDLSLRRLLPSRSARVRVGWLPFGRLEGWFNSYDALTPSTAMRVENVSRWIDGRDGFESELYDPRRRYDIVVLVKAMGARYVEETRRLQDSGTRVVFDANINYYDIWGEYDIPGTEPTEEQRQEAIEITQLADAVVADSTYILGIVRRFNARAVCVPDNVNLKVFHGRREHIGNDGGLRLVWSGVSKKAKPLLTILDPLASLAGAELVLVSDERPEAMAQLQEAISCSFVPFSNRAYARTLLTCDAIISPKRLVNGYELGHSEYKITLGMAVGLPAVASPQPSYVEAIGHAGGGIVADEPAEWLGALQQLAADAALRAELGGRAAQTVVERYSTPVVARKYLDVLETLA